MGLPPGEYRDSEGYHRYFDGRSFHGNKVRGPDGTWRDGPPPRHDKPRHRTDKIDNPGAPPLGARPQVRGNDPSETGLNALGGAVITVVICGAIVLIIRQFAEANRWALLTGCVVLTAATVLLWLAKGWLRIGLAVTAVLCGFGSLWGFNLAKEPPPPAKPNAVTLARTVVAREISGYGDTLCQRLDDAAARRLMARYGVTTCPNALKRLRGQLGEEDAEQIRRSLAVTPVSVEQDLSTPQNMWNVKVTLGENPLELEWLAFTARHVKDRDQWELFEYTGAG